MMVSASKKHFLITDSEPVAKLLCLFKLNSLILENPVQSRVEEDTILTQGTLSLWDWKGIPIKIVEKDYLDTQSLSLTAKLTKEQNIQSLADLADFFGLPSAFKSIYALFALDELSIEAFTSEDRDDEYLQISASINDLQEKTEALLGIKLPLKQLRLDMLVTLKPDTYERDIQLSIFGELQLGQQTVQVELSLPLQLYGQWSLRLLPPGIDISLTSLVEAFGVESQSLPALPEEINTITSFTLLDFYIRFDPTIPKLFDLSFALQTSKEWKLIDPTLSIKKIGFNLSLSRRVDNSWSYRGKIYGTAKIGKLEVSADVPIPLTGLASLRASTHNEKLQLADFESLLGINPSAQLPAGFSDTALRLHELFISVNLDKRALEKFTINVTTEIPWTLWEERLSLNSVNLKLSLAHDGTKWLTSGRVRGSGNLLNRKVEIEIKKNTGGQWWIGLLAPYNLGDVTELLKLTNVDVFDPSTTLLPAPLINEPNLAINIRKLYLAIDKNTISALGTDIQTSGKLAIQNTLAISNVKLYLDIQQPFAAERSLSGEISGMLTIGKHAFLLKASHEDADSGWYFSGESEPGDKIILSDTLALFLPDYKLEEEWNCLAVSDLALEFAPTQGYFLSRGKVFFEKQIINDLKVRLLLDLIFEKKDAVHTISFKGQSVIDLPIGTSEEPKTARLLIAAAYDSAKGWGFGIQTNPKDQKISLKNICLNLFKLEANACPEPLNDLQIKGLNVTCSSNPYLITCAGSSELTLLLNNRQAQFELDLDLKLDADKKLRGMLAGRCKIDQLSLAAQLNLDETISVSLALLEPLPVKDLLSVWVGHDMPAELPDMLLKSFAGTFNLTTQEFTFAGSTTIAWDFLQNGSTLEADIDLKIKRSQIKDVQKNSNVYQLDCSFILSTRGVLKLTDDIQFKDFLFNFVLGQQKWQLDGALNVALFGNSFGITAAYQTIENNTVVKLAGKASLDKVLAKIGPLSLENAFFDIAVNQPKEQTKKQITGSVGFNFLLADSTFSVNASYAETLSFNTRIDEITLSKLSSAVLGVEKPAELPDIVFKNIEINLTPAKRIFSFVGEIAGNWNIDAGAAMLAINKAAVNFNYADGDITASIMVDGYGQLSDDIQFKLFTLSFNYHKNKNWELKGNLQSLLFGQEFELEASYVHETESQKQRLNFAYNRKTTTPLLAVPDIGSLDVKKLSFSLRKEKSASEFIFSAQSKLVIQNLLLLEGELTFAHEKTKDVLAFTPKDATVTIPLFNLPSAEKLNFIFEFGAISISRETINGQSQWGFSASVSFSCPALNKILPPYIQSLFPEKVTTSFIAREKSIKFVADKVIDFRVDIPPLNLEGGISVPIGLTRFSLSNLAITVDKELSLSADFGLGLPAGFNTNFGTNEKGEPSVEIFNTFKPDNPDPTTISLRLGVGTKGVKVQLLSSPFAFISFQEEDGKVWCYADFKDCGAIRFQVPEFSLDIKSRAFIFNGGFEIVRELAIPLNLFKSLFKAAGVQAVNDILPDRVPIQTISLLDENDKLNIDGYVKLVEDLLKITPPNELMSALKIIETGVNNLPDDFRKYLKIAIPKSFNFDIAITPENQGINVKMGVKKGDPPLRVLLPSMGLVPGVIGIELYNFSLGEIFATNFLLMEADVRIDYFDLVSLAGALAIGTDHQLPLPSSNEIQRRFIIEDFFVLIFTAIKIYGVPIPIPIPLFYKELGVEYYGLEGVKAQAHIGFPKPELNVMGLVKAIKDLVMFVAKPDARLEPKALGDMDLRFNVGPTYLQLPVYLGGKFIGRKKAVQFPGAYETVAKVLNALKFKSVNELIMVIPYEYRVGREAIKFGPLSADATFLLTTPTEFTEGAYEKLAISAEKTQEYIKILPALDKQSGAISLANPEEEGLILFLQGGVGIKDWIKGEAIFGLAASDTMGFQTGFKVSASILNLLEMELAGRVTVNAKKAMTLSNGEMLKPPIKAIEFNGVDTCVTFPESLFDLSNGLTMELWLQVDGWCPGAVVVDFGNDSVVDRFTLQLGNTEGELLVINDDQTRKMLEISNVIPIGSWVHLAVSIDNQNQCSIYRDGVSIFEVPITLELPKTIKRRLNFIGKSLNNTAFFKGKLTDFRLWNRVLAIETIKAFKGRRVWGDESGLIAYWPKGYSADGKSHEIIWRNKTEALGARWLSTHKQNLRKLNPAGLLFKTQYDHVSISNPYSDSNDFTFSLWVNTSVIDEGIWGILGEPAGETRKPSLWMNGVGNALCYELVGEDGKKYSGEIPGFFKKKDKWLHIAWVKQGEKLFFYRNGKARGEAEAPAVFQKTGDKYFIGKADTSWNGFIDKVQLWDHALASDVIRANYGFLLTGFEPGLIGYWPFMEGFGRQTLDLVSSNSATIAKAKWAFGPTIVPEGVTFKDEFSFVEVEQAKQLPLVLDDFTLEAWIRPQAFQDDFSSLINVWIGSPAGKQESAATASDSFYWGLSGNKLYFAGLIQNDNQEKFYFTSADSRELPIDKWSHVAVVRAKEKLTFYIDGVAQEGSNVPLPAGKIATAPVAIRIGGQWRGESNGKFTGSLAELRIWNIARETSDVTEFMDKRLIGDEAQLVAYWPFRERCLGKALDYAAQYHGILHSVAWTKLFPFDFQGLKFNGNADRIELGENTRIKTKFTFEAWVKGERGTIFERLGEKDNKGYLSIRFNEYLRIVITDGQTLQCPIKDIPINQWAHLAVSYDGKTMCVFVDGNQVVTQEAAGRLAVSSAAAFMGIGSGEDNLPYKGKMDDVRIWNYARKSHHIKAQMYERLSGQEAGLIHYWPAVLGEGKTLFDLSSSNNGKLYGVVWNKQRYLNLTGRIFDGVNDSITVNNPFTHPEEFTISLWLNPSQLNTGALFPIMGNEVIGDSKRSPALWLGLASGTLHYELHQVAAGDKTNHSGSMENFFLVPNQWVHLAWVKKGRKSLFYRNGHLFAEQEAPTKVWAEEADYQIGRGWSGLMDEICIWNSARSADEIKDDMYFRIGQQPELTTYLPLGDLSLVVADGANEKNNLEKNENFFAQSSQTLNGLKFAGDGDYLDLGYDVPFSSAFTIEAWVSGHQGTLLQREENSQQKGYIELSFSHGFRLVTQEGTGYQLKPQSLPSAEWIHLAASYDGATMRLYINGEHVCSQDAPGGMAKSSARTIIGKRGDDAPGTKFFGRIGEIRLWKKARTDQEISATMNRVLSGLEEDIVGYWPLSEGIGYTAFDKVGRNNGKLRGPTWLQSPFVSMTGVAFNGKRDVINLGSVLNFHTEALSIELWFKSDKVTETSILLYKEKLLTLIIQDGRLQFTWGSEAVSEAGDYFQVKQNEWCHIAVVYSGQEIILYKNGLRVFSRGGLPLTTLSAADLLIGARPQAEIHTDYFTGQIHSVRLWNRARDESEILVDRYKPLSGTEPGLIGYWTLQQDSETPFQNIAGRSVAQWSGNAIEEIITSQTDNVIDKILSGENAIEIAVDSAPFVAAGHAHLKILNQPVFVGDVLLQNDLFAFNGTLDLFPPASPLQVKGAAKGAISKHRFNFRSNVEATFFNFVLAGSKVEISEKGFWLTGTLLEQKVSLSLEKENENRLLFKGSLDTPICLGEIFQLTAGESGDAAQTGPKLMIAGPENPEFAFMGYLKVLGISQQTILVFRDNGFIAHVAGSLWGKFNTKLTLKGSNLTELGMIEFTAEFENGISELVAAIREQLNAAFNHAKSAIENAQLVIEQSSRQLAEEHEKNKRYWEEEARRRREEFERAVQVINDLIGRLQAEAVGHIAEIKRIRDEIQRVSGEFSEKIAQAQRDIDGAQEKVNGILNEIRETENWYNSLPDIDWIWNPHKARDWIWVGPKLGGLWVGHGVATLALQAARDFLGNIDFLQRQAVEGLNITVQGIEALKNSIDAAIHQEQENSRRLRESVPDWVFSPELVVIEVSHAVAQGCLSLANGFLDTTKDLVSGIQYIADACLNTIENFPIQITYARFNGRIGNYSDRKFAVYMDIRYLDLSKREFATTNLNLEVDFDDLMGTASRLIGTVIPSITDNQVELEKRKLIFNAEVEANRQSSA